MPGFKWTVLLIAVLGSAGCSGQSSLDNTIFTQFCKRPSTRNAFGACYELAAVKQMNEFGRDTYSAAPIGQVVTPFPYGQMTTFFTVVASSDARVEINCAGFTTASIAADTLIIYPGSFGDNPVALAQGKRPNGYLISRHFAKGATIAYSGNVPVGCWWNKWTSSKSSSSSTPEEMAALFNNTNF